MPASRVVRCISFLCVIASGPLPGRASGAVPYTGPLETDSAETTDLERGGLLEASELQRPLLPPLRGLSRVVRDAPLDAVKKACTVIRTCILLRIAHFLSKSVPLLSRRFAAQRPTSLPDLAGQNELRDKAFDVVLGKTSGCPTRAEYVDSTNGEQHDELSPLAAFLVPRYGPDQFRELHNLYVALQDTVGALSMRLQACVLDRTNEVRWQGIQHQSAREERFERAVATPCWDALEKIDVRKYEGAGVLLRSHLNMALEAARQCMLETPYDSSKFPSISRAEDVRRRCVEEYDAQRRYVDQQWLNNGFMMFSPWDVRLGLGSLGSGGSVPLSSGLGRW
eukprot:g10641.t1